MESEKTIIKELRKIGINYHDLKEEAQNLLLKIENQMALISEKNCNFLNDITKNKYAINYVTSEIGISRQLLYRSYPKIIKYINSRAEYYRTKDLKLLNKCNDENNEDKIMINNFIARDVEYMELKEKANELEKTIKTLKTENANLKKKLKSLQEDTCNYKKYDPYSHRKS